MGEMLSYGFMQRAFLAAAMISLLCSAMSVFVVLKRFSFIGVGISHAAFGGVALGLVVGVNPTLAAVGFCVAAAWAIGAIARAGVVREDALIGVFFAAAMALGVVLIGQLRGYQADVFGYLFGSILGVSSGDLWATLALGAGVLLVLRLVGKELVFLCFDEEMALVSGLPVRTIYYVLLTLLALTIVVSIKVVGIVLVSALLVIPGATGLQIASNYRTMFQVSVAVGLASAMIGLVLSYRLNAASGATIVLTGTAAFLLSTGVSALRRRLSSRATRAKSRDG
jgi:ABC-type Mn2+/Zn2+ transport system permease subunit